MVDYKRSLGAKLGWAIITTNTNCNDEASYNGII